jgi:hypothetical protein
LAKKPVHQESEMLPKPAATNNSPINEQAEAIFRFACQWLAKGQTAKAIAWYERVLALQPDHQQAAIHLDHLQQKQKWQRETATLTANSDGKLNLSNQKFFVAHRCGWSYALHALELLHNSQGIVFDGFLENFFLRQERQSGEKKEPYTQPWVGFLHNPPAMPKWFYYRDSPQVLFTQENWLKSLDACVGIFTLSEYHARWLRERIDKPVSALIYPTEVTEVQFSFDRFLANPKKKIIQIGWWLRRLASIYQLPIARNNPLGYQKIKLNPAFSLDANAQLQKLVAKQLQVEGTSLDPLFTENTQDIDHISNQEYDTLLSENIVFIHLYDTSANTAIIECIASATPLLVNPLPAVVEYLGKNYPLYFDTLTEAAEKAMDLELIQQAHDYLKHCPTRQKLSADYFRQSFIESEVYQKIKV